MNMEKDLSYLRELARGTTEDVARVRALAAVAQAEAIRALVVELRAIRPLLETGKSMDVTVNVGAWQRFGRRAGRRIARFGLSSRGGTGRAVQAGAATARGLGDATEGAE